MVGGKPHIPETVFDNVIYFIGRQTIIYGIIKGYGILGKAAQTDHAETAYKYVKTKPADRHERQI
jgi:hypothetical protein